MSRKKDKKDIRWVRNTVAFAKLFVLGIILIGIPLILILLYRDTLLSTDFWSQLPDRLARHSLISFLVLIVLQAIQIIICILPGQPIQLASSYMYGVIGGYCISIIGAIIGCLITYRLAHFLGVDAMHIIFGEEKVQNYMKKLNSGKALTIVFLIYLLHRGNFQYRTEAVPAGVHAGAIAGNPGQPADWLLLGQKELYRDRHRRGDHAPSVRMVRPKPRTNR